MTKANEMRGQRAETVVVRFLADLIQVKQAHDDWQRRSEAFAEKIPLFFYAARRACGNITQRELAEVLGIDHTYISKIENGKLMPSMEQMDRLVGLLSKHGFSYSKEDPLHEASVVFDIINDPQ